MQEDGAAANHSAVVEEDRVAKLPANHEVRKKQKQNLQRKGERERERETSATISCLVMRAAVCLRGAKEVTERRVHMCAYLVDMGAACVRVHCCNECLCPRFAFLLSSTPPYSYFSCLSISFSSRFARVHRN